MIISNAILELTQSMCSWKAKTAQYLAVSQSDTDQSWVSASSCIPKWADKTFL